MNAPVRTFFHVGYSSAASTFLQAFFEWHPEIRFSRFKTAWRLFVVPTLHFDSAAARAWFQEESRSSGQTVTVFSHERLSGNPHAGFYDQKEIADRIEHVCPDATIVIIIREQHALMASFYRQYLQIGGTKTLKEYLLHPQDGRVPLFDPRALRYLEYIQYCRRLFGNERVRVHLFESIAGDPDVFLRNLCAELGITTPKAFPAEILAAKNVGLPDNQIDPARSANLGKRTMVSLRDPDEVPAGSSLATQPFLEKGTVIEEVRRLMGGQFTESNQMLAEMLSVNLKDHGYESP